MSALLTTTIEWESVKHVLQYHNYDRSQCKPIILRMIKEKQLIPNIKEKDGKFCVFMDEFELEDFFSKNAAQYYCKRISNV